jgi:hypothetical protein
MKSIRTLLVLLPIAWLTSCDATSGNMIDAATAKAIVAQVDKIIVPIDKRKLKEQYAESVEGDYIVDLGTEDFDKLELIKAGYRASLVGDRTKPVAIIIYINATGSAYLIPFKGVTKLERPRRLTKIADRFYDIESNRSSKGVFSDRVN